MSTNTLTPAAALDTADAIAPAPKAHGDDKVMLRAAANLTRELNAPNATIYWVDTLLSALTGYAMVAVAILATSPWVAVGAAIVAVLTLYRAGLFIHEITHLKAGAIPGYKLGWNVLVGIPLMAPSFMYEGIHNMHHAKIRYGTVEDPEYLPLALMKPWTLPMFVLVAIFGPVALLFRFAVLTPLSLVIPKLRDVVVGKFSGLQINPKFRRPAPEGSSPASGHGWKRPAACGRSPCWRWSRPGSSRCASSRSSSLFRLA